jgi:hypothetical protein
MIFRNDHSKIKYILNPGWVTSKNDGQQHFITAGYLVRLYKVNPDECFYPTQMANWKAIFPNAIVLGPKHSGNYSLPTA